MKRLLDGLGWIGVLLVCAAVVIRFVRPELDTLWWRLAMAGLVVVAAYLATQCREFVTLWSQRSTRAGTLSSVSVLLLLAILIGVNYVAARNNKRWDLTAAGQFTLSDQTRRILASLDPAHHDHSSAEGIALASALGYGERRHTVWNWRAANPALAPWFEAAAARPAFQATLPPVSGI